ncbi:MAG: hypothetical protein Kow0098_09140 [Ignavibacteriaceae bacterium]
MKRAITELDIKALKKKAQLTLTIGPDDILTPSAKDKIKELGITVIIKSAEGESHSNFNGGKFSDLKSTVAIGSDHTGFRVKNILSKFLTEKGYRIIDVGTYDENSCDYPDFAYAVAVKVKNGEAVFGVIIDATGIPSAITANKLSDIRAATCYNEFSARSAREHNNANILVLGAKSLGEETIKAILNTWLVTPFAGGRHQRRLDKISSIEKLNSS